MLLAVGGMLYIDSHMHKLTKNSRLKVEPLVLIVNEFTTNKGNIFTSKSFIRLLMALILYLYSKTCVKRPLSKKTENWFLRPIMA